MWSLTFHDGSQTIVQCYHTVKFHVIHRPEAQSNRAGGKKVRTYQVYELTTDLYLGRIGYFLALTICIGMTNLECLAYGCTV